MSYRASNSDAVPQAGIMTVEQKTIADAGGSVIRRVIRFGYGTRGPTIDSTWLVARTLAPIRERTIVSGGGRIAFDVQGNVVTGQIVSRGSARAVHDTLPGPMINGTDFAFVLCSLPLAVGYRMQVPIYDPEGGGYRLATVRVTGKTSLGDAWLVSVNENSAILDFRIAVATHELIAETIADHDTGYESSILLKLRKVAH